MKIHTSTFFGLLEIGTNGITHLPLRLRCLEKVPQNIFYQMVVKNGDESHGDLPQMVGYTLKHMPLMVNIIY